MAVTKDLKTLTLTGSELQQLVRIVSKHREQLENSDDLFAIAKLHDVKHVEKQLREALHLK